MENHNRRLQSLYETVPDNLGDCIRYFREGSRMTKAELTRKAGVDGASISQYESGITVPSAEAFLGISHALRIKPWILASDEVAKRVKELRNLRSLDSEI